jgi:predicted secreted acid phosphatase
MPRAAVFATLAAGLLAGGAAASADEPAAPASPAEIVAYRESGGWERDITRTVDRARAHLPRHLPARGGRRPALVLDVDDTALSSYACLRAAGFERMPAHRRCAEAAELPAIPQVRALYRRARDRGVAVFFITGRRERARGHTVANLRAAGFARGHRLIMRPNRERPGTHDGYKRRERRAIARRGFRIVANVGDQRSDLRGGYALRAFKLPNPMYVIE